MCPSSCRVRGTTCTTGWCAVSDDRPSDRISPIYETPVTPLSTVDGGKVPRTVDSNADPLTSSSHKVDSGANSTSDLARDALADAQRMSRGRPSRSAQRLRTRRDNLQGRPGGYSGAAPDDTDPQPVGSLIAGYVEDRGWDRPLAAARVF